jgi:iron complex transport system ATP-binding protein
MILLETNSLHVSVGKKDLVDSLDLTVHHNEYWGILGGNGAGKTTLLYTLMGLINSKVGSIQVCGRRLEEYSSKSLAKVMGILFQDSHDAFPVTVMDVVMSGRYPHLKPWSMHTSEDIKAVENALKLVEIEKLACRYVHTLSGGERRRVAIATIIVQMPRIWLLDEPTNYLDMHYQVMILNLLRQRVQVSNGSALMVLHDVNLLTRFCTHAVLIINSNVILTGKVGDVITTENIEALYNHPIRVFSSNNGKFYFPK